jgi:hypothetical protein
MRRSVLKKAKSQLQGTSCYLLQKVHDIRLMRHWVTFAIAGAALVLLVGQDLLIPPDSRIVPAAWEASDSSAT